jgi:hypothetical protein
MKKPIIKLLHIFYGGVQRQNAIVKYSPDGNIPLKVEIYNEDEDIDIEYDDIDYEEDIDAKGFLDIVLENEIVGGILTCL